MDIKDWFLTRRLDVEKQAVLRRLFKSNNVYPVDYATTSPIQRHILWDRPPFSIKGEAVNEYIEALTTAIDIDHPCREPGLRYFLLLREGVNSDTAWEKFEQCRTQCQLNYVAKRRRSIDRLSMIDKEAFKIWKIRYRLAHMNV